MNAYTGAVNLYQWGTPDPMLRTWKNAFPGVIKPRSAIPAYLRPHLRYPEVAVRGQRQILAKYHVQNPQSFYGGQNFWTVPERPDRHQHQQQPEPAALLPDDDHARLPGQSQFSLTTTFTPRGRGRTSPPTWR